MDKVAAAVQISRILKDYDVDMHMGLRQLIDLTKDLTAFMQENMATENANGYYEGRNSAYQEGYDIGYEEGHGLGYSRGYSTQMQYAAERYKAGFNDGYDEALNDAG